MRLLTFVSSNYVSKTFCKYIKWLLDISDLEIERFLMEVKFEDIS